MRTREKIYLGHPNLKRLLGSVPFRNFLTDKYQTNPGLDWYGAIADVLQKLFRTDTTADKVKGAFQQSKLCSADVAKQILALVDIYEGNETGKKVSWKNFDVLYKEEGRAFKKHFRQFQLAQSKDPIPKRNLSGLWTVYSIRYGSIYRSFLDVDFKNDLHIYHLMGKRGRLTYCDIDSRKNNQSITIKGDLEGTLWHYEIKGRFDSIMDGKVNLIRGMVTITHEDQLDISPVLLWRNNSGEETIESIDYQRWGKVTDFDQLSPVAARWEKSLLIYFQYLTENAERVFDAEPAKDMDGWIKSYLRQQGRTKYDTYLRALQMRKWVSLSRLPHDRDGIRIYYWSFEFHPLKQAIQVTRLLKEGEFSETAFIGEMKFQNERFWIEFNAGDRHKVMVLQSTGKAYPGNLYFLAMGSASFINFVNDPGDMLTEIVLPIDHLPMKHQGRYQLSYREFKQLSRVPLDLRLYLNHGDHSILSFDNPNSIKSSLQKQMEATAYKGVYYVYAYHALLDPKYRLMRFLLEIDELAVTTLKKAHTDEQEVIHTYQGLAEDCDKNLHISMEHVWSRHSTLKKQIRSETRLMIDTSMGPRSKAMMTGLISDADREGNILALPCVFVRIDNFEDDFHEHSAKFRALLEKDLSSDQFGPIAHCISGSKEYQLLEELLWIHKKGFLENRFPEYMKRLKPDGINFLETYFNVIGGVFYSDYARENQLIQRLYRNENPVG